MIMTMIIMFAKKLLSHFYTVQDDRSIVGILIQNANNLQVLRCLQI